MVEILLFTFLLIDLLPLTLMRNVKNFERIISFEIFFTMIFYIVLIFIRSPITLGLAYGPSIATFWPSFNLLRFRLGESKMRDRTVSLFSSIIPSIPSIIGPAIGGFIAENFRFETLFASALALYVAAFLLSLRIRFRSEAHRFSIPKDGRFRIFFITFILLGFSETTGLPIPCSFSAFLERFLTWGLCLLPAQSRFP